MDAARRTSSADEAFTLAFGVDTEGMIGELRGYLRLPSFKEIVMPMPADVGTASDVVPMTEPEARLLGADLLLLNGATEEAEKELAPLAALAQGNAAVSVAIGRVRLAQDRRNEAVAALSHSAELSPSSFAAQSYLANALAALSRHEEALNAFDRAIAINPAAPAPWVGLSISALALGRDAQSNAAFKRAMQLDANREWYRRRAYQALAFGRNEVALADARSYIDQVGWSGESGQYMAIAAVIAARRCGTRRRPTRCWPIWAARWTRRHGHPRSLDSLAVEPMRPSSCRMRRGPGSKPRHTPTSVSSPQLRAASTTRLHTSGGSPNRVRGITSRTAWRRPRSIGSRAYPDKQPRAAPDPC